MKLRGCTHKVTAGFMIILLKNISYRYKFYYHKIYYTVYWKNFMIGDYFYKAFINYIDGSCICETEIVSKDIIRQYTHILKPIQYNTYLKYKIV